MPSFPILFLKAAIPGGAAADLFAAAIMVAGHVTSGGTFVAPYASHRKKRHAQAAAPDLFAAPPPAPAPEPAAAHRIIADLGHGPHHAAGREAFGQGAPRQLPSYFTGPTNHNHRAWLAGWDHAAKDGAAEPPPIAPETATTPPPPAAMAHIKRLLAIRQDLADSIENGRQADRQFQGQGRYEDEVREKLAEKIGANDASLAKFRALCEKIGADPDAVIASAGDIADLEPTPVASAKPPPPAEARQPQPDAPTKPALTAPPAAVMSRLKHMLRIGQSLAQDIAEARQIDGGLADPHHETEARAKAAKPLADFASFIGRFRKLARERGLDPEHVLQEAGGIIALPPAKRPKNSPTFDLFSDPDTTLHQPPMEDRPERALAYKPEQWAMPAGVKARGRIAANKAAQAILESKADADMTDADRDALARYTGWGGQGVGTSPNEYFTDPALCEATWELVRKLGFQGGTVLEPSAGTGAFQHTAPPDAQMTAVELSGDSARINRILHGDRDEVVQDSLEGFATYDPRKFDLVIGNPPFGPRHAFRMADLTKTDITRAEQYFLDTALDKTKDGGMVAMILPSGVLDSSSARSFRERILAKGQLLAAFRLPNTAFADSHTEVTTDLVVFRKRAVAPAGAMGSLTTSEKAKLPNWNADFVAGNYMTDGPGSPNIMGSLEPGWRAKAGMGDDITVAGSMDGVAEHIRDFQPGSIPDDTPDFGTILNAAGDDDARARAMRASERRPYPERTPGDTMVKDGILYVLQGEPPRWHRAERDVPEVVTDAIEVANLLDRHLSGDADDTELHRAKLIEALDGFTAKHGAPGSNRALLDWTSHPQLPTGGRDAGQHAELTGQAAKRVSQMLGAVRTDGGYSDAIMGTSSATQAMGAVATTLADKYGAFTVEALALLMAGKTQDHLADELFADPNFAAIPQEAGAWTSRDQYLTGKLWPKYDAALAASTDPDRQPAERERFARQAADLLATIKPMDLGEVQNIEVGSPFVTHACLQAWLDSERSDDGPWTITDDRGVITVAGAPRGYYRHVSEHDLLQKVLMRRGVRKDDAAGVDRLQASFNQWLLADPVWRDATEEKYNRDFRGFLQRSYSNEAMDVPGLNPDFSVNAYHWGGVRRDLDQGRGINAAGVGVGKTPRGLILNAMLRATGRAKKPVIVVPKSLISNWEAMQGMMFPGARVLTIGETVTVKKDGTTTSREDDEPTRRRKLAELTQNEYDFVFMSLPAWNMLNLEDERREQWEQDDFYTQRADALEGKKDKARAKMRDRHEGKVAATKFVAKGERQITLEDTGIDAVILDEGHCFPAGTLVDGRPIETFRAGDIIKAFDHATGAVVESRVLNLQVKTPASLYRVMMNDGTSIVCTGKHPFFTPDGYVYAQDLRAGDGCFRSVLCANANPLDVRPLPSFAGSDEGSGLAPPQEGEAGFLLRQELCEQMASGAPGDRRGYPGGWGGLECGVREALERSADEQGQLDCARGCASEDVCRDEGGRPRTEDPRRQWPPDPATAGCVAVGFGAGMGGGACGDNTQGAGLSAPLQDRPGPPIEDGGSRGGRPIAPITYAAGPGPEEGGFLDSIRVAAVEVLERGSDGEYGGLCPGGVVFNVEVDTHHNYFAEGVLVHNSMKNLSSPESGQFKDLKFLGAPGTPSKQAVATEMKMRWIREKSGGGNTYMLTATPTKNSPLEIYSMLKHVAPEVWTDIGIRNADDFVARFVETSPDVILGTNGEAQDATVVSGFQNMDEIRTVARRYIDRITAADVGLKLPKPEVRQHLVDMSPEQEAAYLELRPRLERALKERDAEGADHPFSIMSDMQKAATDMRLLEPDTAHAPSPKMRAIAANVMEMHKNGGQIIFSDYVGAHTMMRDQLVAAGMNPARIGIINAAVTPSSGSRQKVADAFNAGKLDVVIGNTATMGEGLNLQKRTTDIHHADTPWEPASVIQRNGRGLRQGNNKEAVGLHTYISKGSFDGYRWQAMMAKGDWQEAFWGGGNRVDNMARGSVGRLDMLIASSANPEDAREKFAAQLTEAKDRRAASAALEAHQTWSSYRDTKRQLAAMTRRREQGNYRLPKDEHLGESPTERKLAQRVARLRQNLDDNKAFLHMDAIDAPDVLVDHRSGRVWRKGDEIEVQPGGKFNTHSTEPESYIVHSVDEAGGRVALMPAGYANDPKGDMHARAVDPALLRDGVSATKVDREAAAARQIRRNVEAVTAREAAKVAAADRAASQARKVAASKAEGILAGTAHGHPGDLTGMPDEWLEQHGDALQRQLRAGFASHAAGYGGTVTRAPDGGLHHWPYHSTSKIPADHRILMPTTANRDALIEAEVGHRLNAPLESAYSTPSRGGRGRSYGGSEYAGLERKAPAGASIAGKASPAAEGLEALFPTEKAKISATIAERADARAAERVRQAGNFGDALEAARGGFHHVGATTTPALSYQMKAAALRPETMAALHDAAVKHGVNEKRIGDVPIYAGGHVSASSATRLAIQRALGEAGGSYTPLGRQLRDQMKAHHPDHPETKRLHSDGDAGPSSVARAA